MRRVIFDFSRPEAANWEPVNDGVMGGESNSDFSFEPEGCCVFSGTVSFANNGGFASVRSPLIADDSSAAKGLVLECRGDGREYKLGVRLDTAFDGLVWQAVFIADPAWQRQRFHWDDFYPTYHGRPVPDAPPFEPARIRRFGLLIARQAGAFRLELQSLGLLR